MRYFTLIVIGAMGLLRPFSSKAQTTEPVYGYYADILEYTRQGLIGSARMQAIGGAKASLGADLSLAAVNPAGLAFYNKSHVSISPTVYSRQAQAGYLGSQSRDFRNPFGLATFGLALNSDMDGPTGDWRAGNLVLTHTRLHTYSDRVTYSGELTGLDTYNDFVGYALEELSLFGTEGASDLAYSAYDTFLVLGPAEGFSDFTALVDVPTAQTPTQQREVIETNGRKNVFNVAYAANYRDKFYVGGGIGFVSVERAINRTFTETPYATDSSFLISTAIEENRSQDGNGYYANFGIIYRPITTLTLGVSVESGTFMQLSEEFSQYVVSTFTPDYPYGGGGAIESGIELDPAFEYNAISPMRLRGGATVFLGKSGFISADVEYVDFSNVRVATTSFSLAGDNQTIADLYRGALNYSVGGEYRQGNFYGRVGYAFKADPLADPIPEISREVHYFSAGVGARFDWFTLDVAYVNGRTQSEWNRYFGGPWANVQNTENRIGVTLGANF